MDRQYEKFCVVDPLFYDALSSGRAGAVRFAAADRPVPDGWEREALDDWLGDGRVGRSLPDQGWKVHVSACRDNAERGLDAVSGYCFGHDLPFKFIHGPAALLMRNAKYAHRGASGKFITVYPRDEAELELTCERLGALLDGEPGPYILSDLRLGAGPLHVRYGGFAARYCVVDGKVEPAVADPSGTLVPDRRNPVFTVPEWVTLPAFLAPHLAARNATTTADLPYRVERVMHFSNGGGIYAATDTRSGERVVLKEARPHAGLDAAGNDAVTRLDREHEALRRLADLPSVPRVRDRFALGEHTFLALEHIDGVPLNKLVVERYPLVDPTAGPSQYAAYAEWALDIHRQVAETIAAVHERGLVYGDLHLFNVLVRPDDTAVLVDFEVAGPVERYRRPGLRNQGFAAPRSVSGRDVDTFALACLKLALFLPLTTMLRLAPDKAHHFADVIAERFGLPPDTFADAVATISPAEQAPAPPRLQPDPSGWAVMRWQIADAILDTATPYRDDRLFPGDVEQFHSGGLNLAHGAAGVLYALHVTGAGRHPDLEAWLVRRALDPPPRTRLGLYDGLHGVAHTLDVLGRREEALDVLDRCRREPWDGLGPDLMGGLAGIGLNLLHFGDDAAAWQATDRLTSGATGSHAGLTHGATGPALLFLRMYERFGDPALLDLAVSAVYRDLDRCVRRADGALEVDEGWRTMPYLAHGSAGIGIVVDQLLAYRDDQRLREAADGIALAARSPFYAQSGLFAGRAGIIRYLATHDPGGVELRGQIRDLAWHAVRYRGRLAFPGDQLLRLSMDLATGSAGVLLALGSALHDRPVDLPFLSPAATPELPSDRRVWKSETSMERGRCHDTPGPAGTGTVLRERPGVGRR